MIDKISFFCVFISFLFWTKDVDASVVALKYHPIHEDLMFKRNVIPFPGSIVRYAEFFVPITFGNQVYHLQFDTGKKNLKGKKHITKIV